MSIANSPDLSPVNLGNGYTLKFQRSSAGIRAVIAQPDQELLVRSTVVPESQAAAAKAEVLRSKEWMDTLLKKSDRLGMGDIDDIDDEDDEDED